MSKKDFTSTGFEAFLVCDKSLGDPNAPFMKWLESEGFNFGQLGHGCYSNVWWVYINLTSKLYIYGMPGIKMTNTICNHAITIDEFKTIYGIYKKYEGKDIFVFHKKRFDYDREEGEEDDDDEPAPEEPVVRFLSELPTYEQFCDGVKDYLNDYYYKEHPDVVDELMNDEETTCYLERGYESVTKLWEERELSEQKYRWEKDATAHCICWAN